MPRVCFALTALDARLVPPLPGLDEPLSPPWPGPPLPKVPVIRLFGVTMQGGSVCAHVHGYRPCFYLELDEERAVALSQPAEDAAAAAGAQKAAEGPLAAPGELAAAIEAAAARHGRPQTRVCGLSLVRRRSAYGLHLEDGPFLRVELMDFRDAEALAATLQGGAVPALGRPQAHEVHLPFLSHFLAEHDLAGAGRVRVTGDARGDGGRPGAPARQTCCGVELDVRAPDGILNHGDYVDLLWRAGACPESRIRAALRARLDDASASQSASEATGAGGARPTPGARTTPLPAREGICRWLRGGGPMADAPWANSTDAWVGGAMVAGGGQGPPLAPVGDIEDLAGPRPPPAAAAQRREASPARYSDPADDPRNNAVARAGPAAADDAQAEPSSQPNALAMLSGIGAPVAGPAAQAAADAQKKDASSGLLLGGADLEWEELCGVVSVEAICAAGEKGAIPLTAVAYAVRPHVCQLGARRLRRADRRGAIVVARSDADAGTWRLVAASPSDQHQVGEVRVVRSEGELLEELVALVRDADPDLCLGWELRSRSWGLLLARARALGRRDLQVALSRAPFDGQAPAQAPRGAAASSGGKARVAAADREFGNGWGRTGRESSDPSNFESQMIAPSEVQFTGRLSLNVWRVLTHLTFGAKLRSDAPQEVSRELLGRNFPLIPEAEQVRLWEGGGMVERLAVLRYAQSLAALSIEVFDKLEVLPRAGELSRLFGMDVLSGFTRGTQLRVESVLMRAARAGGFLLLSATHAQVRAQPALECLPLVMEPESGFYWDPVLVFDFKGMYPSLIVAHNISFDTCLGRARRAGYCGGSGGGLPACRLGVREEPWALGSPEAVSCLAARFDAEGLGSAAEDSPVRLLPSGVMFAAQAVKRGLLPLMLDWAIRLRGEAKRLMKTAPAPVALRLNQRQFALKYFANVTYGYAGASFSGRMPSAEIADAIVATGRRALEEAADYIEAKVPGAHVIYGDTDSVFVQLRGASLEEAFATGRRLVGEISALHPTPVELEFEKVYYPAVCLTKKRYGGLAYAKPPSEGGAPTFEAKGIEAVRRDQCRLTSDLQRELLFEAFRTKDLSAVRRLFARRASELLRGDATGPPLTDLVFHREARLGTYRAEEEDNVCATLPPQATVAHNMMAAEGSGAGPEFGARVAYVVGCGPAGARLIDKCVAPAQVMEGGAASAGSTGLDRWWYVEKALVPCLARTFQTGLHGLPQVDVSSWLRRIPRPAASSSGAAGSFGGGPLDRLLRPSCKRCKLREAVRGVGVCGRCASHDERELAARRAREARSAVAALQATCQACAGPALWRSCAAAAFCPVLGRRLAAESAARLAADDALRLGLQLEEEDAVMVSDSEPEGLAPPSQTQASQPGDVKMECSEGEGGAKAAAPLPVAAPPAPSTGAKVEPNMGNAAEAAVVGKPGPSRAPRAKARRAATRRAAPPGPAAAAAAVVPEWQRVVTIAVEDSDDEGAGAAGAAAAEAAALPAPDVAAQAAAAGPPSSGPPVQVVEPPPPPADGGFLPPPPPPAGAAPAVAPPCCKTHGEPCKELEVRKPGPNLGRRFYACARPREEQCNFFAWAKPTGGAAAASPGAAPSATAAAAAGGPGADQGAAAGGGAAVEPKTPQRKRQAKNRPVPGSARKRARPSGTGGRLERFVPAPSKRVAERIERAKEHRLLLLRAQAGDHGAVEASVVGHTGNVYDARLGARVECSCPDFAKAKRACKHLLFLLLRVLEVPQDDPRVWQRALLPQELRDLRERLERRLGSEELSGVAAPAPVLSAFEAAGGPVVRQPLGQPCTICFDPVLAKAGSTCCPACGRNFHEECASQWTAATQGPPSCPLCRCGWATEEAAAASKVAPGQALPRRVNLAAHSELHAQPMSIEQSYPATHQWIARRESLGPRTAAPADGHAGTATG